MRHHLSLQAVTFGLATFVIAFTMSAGAAQAPAVPKPQPPRTSRLYVFDCGIINVGRTGPERYHVTAEEVGETRLVVPCYLVAHPKGTLMWDLGIIPDSTIEARARGEKGNPTISAAAVATRTLTSQLAELGYRPADITYFAFSHAHTGLNEDLPLRTTGPGSARRCGSDQGTPLGRSGR